MALEEVVVGHYTDLDFGVLQLIETRTEAQVDGGPWKSLIFRAWTGRRQDLAATLHIFNGENPPAVGDDIRAAFRAIVLDIAAFKQSVAETQLGLARDWAMQGGLNLRLNASTLADALTITDFGVDDDRLTVYLEDSANIFDGHALEVRIENGSVMEIVLAG